METFDGRLNQPLQEKQLPILRINKPTHIEASILELSKTLMHEFHYKLLKINTTTKLDCCSLILIA